MVSYYEPGDVASMTDAIYHLYCRPQARREQAERANKFLEDFGWERQGGELVTFYRALVDN
jgi:hypothetical protein